MAAADADLARIAHAAASLTAQPDDLSALLVVARGLASLGAQPGAAQALALLGRAAGDTGALPLALLAAKELEPLEPKAAGELVAELAKAFGAGSARVNPDFRPGPPPRTRNVPALGQPPSGSAEVLAAAQAALAAAEKAVRPPPGKLPALPLFRALDPAAFTRLVSVLLPRHVSAGQVILEQGSAAASFYVIARGRVRIEQHGAHGDVVLSRLTGGAFFGEMALLGDTRRVAGAVAETDVDLFEVSRAPLEKLAGEVPRLAEVLAEHSRDRLIANLMVTSAIFREVEPAERAKLAARFSRRVFAAQARILEEGGEGDGIYVLVSGAVDVVKKDAGGEKVVLSRLGPGDVFGEMSLLGRRPAQARIVAVEKTAALHLSRQAFDEVAGQYPTLIAHLYQLQVSREKDNERLLAAEPVEADDYLI